MFNFSQVSSPFLSLLLLLSHNISPRRALQSLQKVPEMQKDTIRISFPTLGLGDLVSSGLAVLVLLLLTAVSAWPCSPGWLSPSELGMMFS